MPTVQGPKVADFVKASRKYVEEGLRKANVDGNANLTKTEAAALPRDLKDNFENFAARQPGGRVKVKQFAGSFASYVAAAAKAADKDRDGYLATTEAKNLPKDLRDNFWHYFNGAGRTDGTVPRTKDATPASLIRKHEAAYGTHAISYQEAFKKAALAVLKYEDGESPRAIMREQGGPDGDPIDDDKKLEAALRALLAKGSLKLLPVGESGESYGDPAESWILSVRVDVPTDHAFWAVVNRKTGEATVEGFN